MKRALAPLAFDLTLFGIPSAVAVAGMFLSPLVREADYEFSFLVLLSVALCFPIASWRLVSRTQDVRTLGLALLLGLLAPTLCAGGSYSIGPACGGWTAPCLYLLEVVPTALYAASFAASVALLLGRNYLRVQKLILAAFIFGHCALTLLRLYSGPSVFFYDHLLGYFPGSLYDERIEVTRAFVALRVVTFLRIGALGLLAWAKNRTPERTPRRLILSALLIFCCDLFMGPAFHYRISWRDLEKELPIVRTQNGLTVHLPAETTAELAEAVLQDHLFRVAQVRRKLGVKAPENLHSFVYRDSTQKAQWMGCRNTLVAKPWQKAMHTHPVSRFAQPVAHELVHLLLAPDAEGPLSLTTRYWFWPNMGVVEGMAEGFVAPSGALDVHAQAQALQAQGRAWRPSELLGPQAFWSQAPGRAYPVVGSFLSFLGDKYGGAKLRSLYRDGAFTRVFELPLVELERDWQKALDARPLAPQEHALANDVGRVPSLFCRRCPHQAARLRAKVASANLMGRRKLFTDICRFEAHSVYCQLEQAFAYLALGDTDGGSHILEMLEAKITGMGRQMQAAVSLGRARVAVKNHEIAQARAFARRALDQAPDVASRRTATLMLGLLEDPDAAPTLSYFDLPARKSDAHEKGLDPVTVRNERLADFLRGRQSFQQEDFSHALFFLERAGNNLPPTLDEERQLLISQAALFSGDTARAESAQNSACAHLRLSGEQARCLDFRERIDFFKQLQAET